MRTGTTGVGLISLRYSATLAEDQTPAAAEKTRAEPIPRLARLMALALRLEGLVRDGQVTDYAELARLGHVSRARVSQILSLVLLAPDIQETLLFLPGGANGGTVLTERHLRPIAAEPDWSRQRQLWQQLPSPTHQNRRNGNKPHV